MRVYAVVAVYLVLFVLSGSNGRAPSTETPTTDRQHWLLDLPPRVGPLGPFYCGKASAKPCHVDHDFHHVLQNHFSKPKTTVRVWPDGCKG
jgi:hypothetical protein